MVTFLSSFGNFVTQIQFTNYSTIRSEDKSNIVPPFLGGFSGVYARDRNEAWTIRRVRVKK